MKTLSRLVIYCYYKYLVTILSLQFFLFESQQIKQNRFYRKYLFFRIFFCLFTNYTTIQSSYFLGYLVFNLIHEIKMNLLFMLIPFFIKYLSLFCSFQKRRILSQTFQCLMLSQYTWYFLN